MARPKEIVDAEKRLAEASATDIDEMHAPSCTELALAVNQRLLLKLVEGLMEKGATC